MDDQELPPVDTARWSARLKAIVVRAVNSGRLGFEAACARWRLSREELQAWRMVYGLYGERALRATRIQRYRAAFRYRNEHATPLGQVIVIGPPRRVARSPRKAARPRSR